MHPHRATPTQHRPLSQKVAASSVWTPQPISASLFSLTPSLSMPSTPISISNARSSASPNRPAQPQRMSVRGSPPSAFLSSAGANTGSSQMQLFFPINSTTMESRTSFPSKQQSQPPFDLHQTSLDSSRSIMSNTAAPSSTLPRPAPSKSQYHATPSSFSPFASSPRGARFAMPPLQTASSAPIALPPSSNQFMVNGNINMSTNDLPNLAPPRFQMQSIRSVAKSLALPQSSASSPSSSLSNLHQYPHQPLTSHPSTSSIGSSLSLPVTPPSAPPPPTVTPATAAAAGLSVYSPRSTSPSSTHASSSSSSNSSSVVHSRSSSVSDLHGGLVPSFSQSDFASSSQFSQLPAPFLVNTPRSGGRFLSASASSSPMVVMSPLSPSTLSPSSSYASSPAESPIASRQPTPPPPPMQLQPQLHEQQELPTLDEPLRFQDLVSDLHGDAKYQEDQPPSITLTVDELSLLRAANADLVHQLSLLHDQHQLELQQQSESLQRRIVELEWTCVQERQQRESDVIQLAQQALAACSVADGLHSEVEELKGTLSRSGSQAALNHADHDDGIFELSYQHQQQQQEQSQQQPAPEPSSLTQEIGENQDYQRQFLPSPAPSHSRSPSVALTMPPLISSASVDLIDFASTDGSTTMEPTQLDFFQSSSDGAAQLTQQTLPPSPLDFANAFASSCSSPLSFGTTNHLMHDRQTSFGLKNFCRQCVDLQSESSHLHQQLTALREHCDSMEEKYNRDVKQLGDDALRACELADQLQARVMQQKSELANKHQTIEQLRAELSALQQYQQQQQQHLDLPRPIKIELVVSIANDVDVVADRSPAAESSCLQTKSELESEVARLSLELQATQDKLRVVRESSMQELNGVRGQLEGANQTLVDAGQLLKQHDQAHEQERDDWQSRWLDLQIELQSLRQQLVTKDREFEATLVQNRREWDEQHLVLLEQLHAEATRSKEVSAWMEDGLRRRVAELESELEQVKSAAADQQASSHYAIVENELRLRDEIFKLHAELSDSESRTQVEKLQSELTAQSQQVSEWRSRVDELGDRLESESESHTERLRELESLLTSALAEIQQYQSDARDHKLILQSREHELQAALESLSAAEKRHEEAQTASLADEAELASQRALLESVQHQLQDKDADIAALQSQVSLSKSELARTVAQLKHEYEQSVNWQKQLTEKQQLVDRVFGELSSLRAQGADQELQMDELRTELQRMLALQQQLDSQSSGAATVNPCTASGCACQCHSLPSSPGGSKLMSPRQGVTPRSSYISSTSSMQVCLTESQRAVLMMLAAFIQQNIVEFLEQIFEFSSVPIQPMSTSLSSNSITSSSSSTPIDFLSLISSPRLSSSSQSLPRRFSRPRAKLVLFAVCTILCTLLDLTANE